MRSVSLVRPLLCRNSNKSSRTNPRQCTLLTERSTCITDSTPVKDQQVREIKPIFSWHNTHQILLDLDWIFIFRPAKTTYQATHVRIHNKPHHDAKGISQHHIGRLARHPWQGEQILH